MDKKYKEVKEIAYKDYLEFIKEKTTVIIEDEEIKLQKNWNIKSYSPPQDYTPKCTTVWGFPDRGNWPALRGNYRGNWVLDQMMGSIISYAKNKNGVRKYDQYL